MAAIPSNGSRAQKVPIRQGALQGALRDRVHVQLAEAGSPFRHSVRENSSQLRLRRIDRVHSLVAANVVPGSSFERALMCIRER